MFCTNFVFTDINGDGILNSTNDVTDLDQSVSYKDLKTKVAGYIEETR
jgi:hypothetical protein